VTKRIVVTGGAGFIGSALVRRLIATTDATVINIDKLTYAGNLESLAGARDDPRHRFEQVDIADAPAIRRILATGQPDAVIHLAAESHVDRSIDGAEEFVRTNVLGTFVLLQEALGYWESLPVERRQQFRFLHSSTDEVFGSLGATGRFSETSPYNPTSPYAATKAAADHLVRVWYRTYRLPVLITNASNNYGPYQFPEKLIPLLLCRALAGEDLPVYGDGTQVRDWLFVEDHINALLDVLNHGVPGETYAIGGNNEYRTLDAARAVCAVLDELSPRLAGGSYSELIRLVEDRPAHDFRYAMDTTKIRDAAGWRPVESFPTGLRKTISWYLTNPEWLARVRSGGYHGERLGLARPPSA